ncbi:hypothetical protein [Microbispora sp. H13382]|uniref:hypothetical protein n=1 Tax=Microbispora sp. H13382 TaxID=2729112 RepID=UPI00217618E8|nr:hypothetical protein [Microbispora sp. H13382]
MTVDDPDIPEVGQPFGQDLVREAGQRAAELAERTVASEEFAERVSSTCRGVPRG